MIYKIIHMTEFIKDYHLALVNFLLRIYASFLEK